MIIENATRCGTSGCKSAWCVVSGGSKIPFYIDAKNFYRVGMQKPLLNAEIKFDKTTSVEKHYQYHIMLKLGMRWKLIRVLQILPEGCLDVSPVFTRENITFFWIL